MRAGGQLNAHLEGVAALGLVADLPHSSVNGIQFGARHGTRLVGPLIRPTSDTPMVRLALERAASCWTFGVVMMALQDGPRRFSKLGAATRAG